MYDAVNKGMRQATGDILCYLNSDDLFFPWTLEVVVDAFRRWPERASIHGDVPNVDDETGRQLLYLEPPYDHDYLRGSGSMSQPGVFWRREVMSNLAEFDTSLRFVGDLDFFIRAGRCRAPPEGQRVSRDRAEPSWDPQSGRRGGDASRDRCPPGSLCARFWMAPLDRRRARWHLATSMVSWVLARAAPAGITSRERADQVVAQAPGSEPRSMSRRAGSSRCCWFRLQGGVSGRRWSSRAGTGFGCRVDEQPAR